MGRGIPSRLHHSGSRQFVKHVAGRRWLLPAEGAPDKPRCWRAMAASGQSGIGNDLFASVIRHSLPPVIGSGIKGVSVNYPRRFQPRYVRRRHSQQLAEYIVVVGADVAVFAESNGRFRHSGGD